MKQNVGSQLEKKNIVIIGWMGFNIVKDPNLLLIPTLNIFSLSKFSESVKHLFYQWRQSSCLFTL